MLRGSLPEGSVDTLLRGYISPVATSFVKNNRGTPFIGDMFIWFDRTSSYETPCTHEASDCQFI